MRQIRQVAEILGVVDAVADDEADIVGLDRRLAAALGGAKRRYGTQTTRTPAAIWRRDRLNPPSPTPSSSTMMSTL